MEGRRGESVFIVEDNYSKLIWRATLCHSLAEVRQRHAICLSMYRAESREPRHTKSLSALIVANGNTKGWE